MNNQEFFTKTVLHLRAQGQQALLRDAAGSPLLNYVGEVRCAYRDGKLSCAVGCHIPDEMYSPKLENNPYALLADLSAGLDRVFAGVDYALVVGMQNIHDSRPVASWEEHFGYMAKRYKLDMP